MEDHTLVTKQHYMKSAACLAMDLKFLLENAPILPFRGSQILIPVIGVDCLLCTSYNSAGVTCLGPNTNILGCTYGDIQLADGPSSRDRLKICNRDGYWTSACVSGIDKTAALIVCKSLRLNATGSVVKHNIICANILLIYFRSESVIRTVSHIHWSMLNIDFHFPFLLEPCFLAYYIIYAFKSYIPLTFLQRMFLVIY